MASAAEVKALDSDPMGMAVWASTFLTGGDAAHAIALGQRDLAVLNDGQRQAGGTECLHGVGDRRVGVRRWRGGVRA